MANLGLTACAGVGSNYATPAPRHQIQYEVVPITPSLVSETRRVPPQFPQSLKLSQSLTDADESDTYTYTIGAGDVLSIFIARLRAATPATPSSDAETQYLVNENGRIFIPLHGALVVGGLSIGDAYEKVRGALAQYITSPQVNIRVAEFRSQRVTVAGAVANTGFFPITDRPMTITELTVLAQPTGDADLRHVVLKRDGVDRAVDVVALMESADFGDTWVLKDRDVVVIPPNRNKVYVVGEAPNRTETIDPYDNSLAEVLVGKTNSSSGSNASGGYLQGGAAKPSHVFVVRPNSNAATVFHLDATSPESFLLASNFQLASGDVVYVATRKISRYNRFLSQILPTLQTILVPALIFDQFDKD